MVREALGPELADVLVPLVEGGVLKHDTCSTENTKFMGSCMIPAVLQTGSRL